MGVIKTELIINESNFTGSALETEIKSMIISVNQQLFELGYTVEEVLKFWQDMKIEVKKNK